MKKPPPNLPRKGRRLPSFGGVRGRLIIQL